MTVNDDISSKLPPNLDSFPQDQPLEVIILTTRPDLNSLKTIPEKQRAIRAQFEPLQQYLKQQGITEFYGGPNLGFAIADLTPAQIYDLAAQPYVARITKNTGLEVDLL